jgi:hypothetical protein
MYAFPFGVQELEGIAARGDFDLSRHQEFSGKSMEYFDQDTNEKFIPHVVEPSAGVDRICLALLCNGYAEVGETAIAQATGLVAEVASWCGRGGPTSATQVSFYSCVRGRGAIAGGQSVFTFDAAPGGSGASVAIRKSTDGGANWTTVQTITNLTALHGVTSVDDVALDRGDILGMVCTLPAAAPSTILTAAIPVRW